MFEMENNRSDDATGQRVHRREESTRVRPRHGGRQQRKRKSLLAVAGMQNRRNKHWTW
jgi:hypothetical protein